jgi:RHS repeat-associated protein
LISTRGGGETNRSANSAFQPHKYTSYERDGNGGDDAMMRRYQSSWIRFSQPDPYDGSYSLADPQSLNRYSYVQNDPVNFVDPSGLLRVCYYSQWGYLIDVHGAPNGIVPLYRLDFCIDYPDEPNREPPEPRPGRRERPNRNHAEPQRTKEERCLEAINDANSIAKRINQTIADSLIEGVDQGHVQKIGELKNGLEDALRRIDANCNNHNKTQHFEDIKHDRETLKNPTPKVGESIHIGRYKVAAAVGTIVGTVGIAAKAVWTWIFAH